MMPSGTYYVGDLCYVLHDEWNEIMKLIFPPSGECLDGEFNLSDGRRFAIYSTLYGDGSFNSNTGHEFGVDAGSIGCIKIDDIDRTHRSNDVTLGTIFEFHEPFETSGGRNHRNWDGIIHIGHVEIYTGYDDEEDEEYYED